ncbi:MAG TPA: hypothetical protein VGI88_15345 [Verrucomicrobiae bacterium]
MPSHLLKVPALLLLCSLCACKSLQHSNATPPPAEPETAEKSPADLQTRNNALALLDDLLNDEKNLSKILIIKRNSDELGRLVENISKTAGKGADSLESLAKSEPGLDLKKTDLPPGEIATRKAISKTKEHELLHSKDAEFEFQLLLTQAEALNYGSHLCMVVAENESQAGRTREFLELGAQLRNLREQVVAMLRSRK